MVMQIVKSRSDSTGRFLQMPVPKVNFIDVSVQFHYSNSVK